MTTEFARNILKALVDGVNPVTGEVLGEQNAYTVISSNEMVDVLRYVLKIISPQEIPQAKRPPKKKELRPFILTESEKSQIQLDDEEKRTAYEIANLINNVIPKERRQMKANDVNGWFAKKGILEKVENKKVAKKGRNIGVRKDQDKRTHKWSITYPIQLQYEVVNHAEEIMQGTAFVLLDEEKVRIQNQLDPNRDLTDAEISGKINAVIPPEREKILPWKIADWFTKEGILTDGISYKKSRYGKERGVKSSEVVRYGKTFWRLEFPAELQREVIDHAEEVVNGATDETEES